MLSFIDEIGFINQKFLIILRSLSAGKHKKDCCISSYLAHRLALNFLLQLGKLSAEPIGYQSKVKDFLEEN